MAEIFNPANDILGAYFKGKQIRQQREALTQRNLQAQQQAELQQQKLQDAWNIHEQKLTETKRINDAKIAKQKIDSDLAMKKLRVELAAGIQSGLIEPDPENPGEFRDTPAGTKAKKDAEAAALKANALVEPALKKEQGVEDIRQLNRQSNILLQGDVASQKQLNQQNFDREQKELDRKNKIQVSEIRARATAANKLASKEEKEATFNDFYANVESEIISGNRTLENLPKGEVGLKVQNEAYKKGWKFVTNKQVDQLNGMAGLQSFYTKADALREAIDKGEMARAKTLQDELAADLVIFGRNAKEEKGVVTNADITRLETALPQFFPGGVITSVLGKEKRKNVNLRRVKELEKLVKEKRSKLIGNMKPEQQKAVSERYGLMTFMNPDAERID